MSSNPLDDSLARLTVGDSPGSDPVDESMDWEAGDDEVDPSTAALLSFNERRLDETINAAARCVWSVAALRPRQRIAIRTLFHPGRPNHLVVVERTGGGKH